jgi:hypothetical protein
MQRLKVEEIKKLVQEVFPDFKEEANITPIAIRCYLRRRLPENVLYETAVLIPSRENCWVRIENLCNYLKSVRYWSSL